MAKFIIGIRRVEYFNEDVVVDAKNIDEAVKKVKKEWAESDYLYEFVTDCLSECETNFLKIGVATEKDINTLINIK